MRPLLTLLTAFVVLGLGLAFAAPKGKTKAGDVIWTHPDVASYPVTSIALLPAASFDNSHKSERTIETHFSQALRPTGYRWISPLIAKDMLRASLGEAALAALDQEIIRLGRVDSASAGRICRALRATAVMSARVDLFEQVKVEWNQAGKPSTTIQVRAALLDSTGRLLWSAAGSETAEGPYHDRGAATLGVKGSGLNTEPITGQGGPPSFEEVSTRLFTRWIQHFPGFKAPAPAVGSANSPATDSTQASTPEKP